MKFPNLVEFLTEFGSVFFDDLFVFTELPKLQPRFYSISSSPLDSSNSIELTMRVVEYTTNKGDQHYGVCTKWLDDADQNEIVHLFTKEYIFNIKNRNNKKLIKFFFVKSDKLSFAKCKIKTNYNDWCRYWYSPF